MHEYIQQSALIPDHILKEAPYNRLATWAAGAVFSDPRTKAPEGDISRLAKWVAPDTHEQAEETHLGKLAANWMWKQLVATVKRKEKEEDGIQADVLEKMIGALNIRPNQTYEASGAMNELPTIQWLRDHGTDKLKEVDIAPMLQNLGHESVRWGKQEYEAGPSGKAAMTNPEEIINIINTAGFDDFTNSRILRLAVSFSTKETIPPEDTTL